MYYVGTRAAEILISDFNGFLNAYFKFFNFFKVGVSNLRLFFSQKSKNIEQNELNMAKISGLYSIEIFIRILLYRRTINSSFLIYFSPLFLYNSFSSYLLRSPYSSS